MIQWWPIHRFYWSKIRGTGNSVQLGTDARLSGYVEIRGTGNRIIFGAGAKFTGKIFVKGHNQTLTIGARSSLRNAYVVMQENCDISIGDDCLFSRNVEIRTSDAHSLVDAANGKRLNLPASVTIGNHVWIGAKAFISKGAVVADDSVVGAMSFVGDEFVEPGVLIAGVPAKVLRTGINWHVERRRRFVVTP